MPGAVLALIILCIILCACWQGPGLCHLCSPRQPEPLCRWMRERLNLEGKEWGSWMVRTLATPSTNREPAELGGLPLATACLCSAQASPEKASHQQSSLSWVPSVLDCWSQETRPGCRHQLGGLGHLASPGGQCAAEPLDYCRPARSAPPSSGSGPCLQARSGGGRLRRAERRPRSLQSARPATVSGLWLPRVQNTLIHWAP